MSETAEQRTIAEIIDGRDYATVDDLLAWLHDRPNWTAVEIRTSAGGHRVKVFDELGPSIERRSPTLLAALEDAVRQVDARWSLRVNRE